MLRRFDIFDVASLAFTDRFGCQALLAESPADRKRRDYPEATARPSPGNATGAP
jgi:hypothetical protein